MKKNGFDVVGFLTCLQLTTDCQRPIENGHKNLWHSRPQKEKSTHMTNPTDYKSRKITRHQIPSLSGRDFIELRYDGTQNENQRSWAEWIECG